MHRHRSALGRCAVRRRRRAERRLREQGERPNVVNGTVQPCRTLRLEEGGWAPLQAATAVGGAGGRKLGVDRGVKVERERPRGRRRFARASARDRGLEAHRPAAGARRDKARVQLDAVSLVDYGLRAVAAPVVRHEAVTLEAVLLALVAQRQPVRCPHQPRR